MSDHKVGEGLSKRTFFSRLSDLISMPHSAIVDVGERRRATLLAWLSAFFFIFILIGTFASLTVRLRDGRSLTTVFILGIVSVVLIGIYLLSRSRYFRIGAFLFVGSLLVAAFGNIIAGSATTPEGTLFSFIPITFVLGSALLSLPALVVLVAISLFGVVYFAGAMGSVFGVLAILGILVLVVVAFRNAIERERVRELTDTNQELLALREGLEQRVADRTTALLLSGNISRQLSEILDKNRLVAAVVEALQDAFNYYHVHIYLYDDMHESLVMMGGTGGAGKTMLAAGHKIGRGKGLVGRAAEQQDIVLVSNTAEDPSWLPNPLLPDTKSEIAVPISIGDRVMGVLDVQHNEIGVLGEEDMDLLNSIANQVAIALQNADQYEQTSAALEQANIFRQFALAAGQGMCVSNMDGEIVYANPTLVEMLGFESSLDLEGVSFVQYYPEDIQERFQNEILPQVMNEGQWLGELTLLSSTGIATPTLENFFIIRDDDGNPLYIADVVSDITERKEDEARIQALVEERTAELSASEDRFSRMATTMADGLMIIEAGKVVFVNHRLSEILGYSVDELAVMSSFQYAAPEERPRLMELTEHTGDGEALDDLSFWIIRADGERRFIHNRYSVLFDLDGKPIGQFVLTTDETESKLLEQQIQETLERRGYQVQVSTQIAQEIAAAPALDVLFSRVVALIKEQFGYYHAQIYRFDAGINAMKLVEGYGDIGRQMLEVGHNLPMGTGLVGVAAVTGEAVMRPILADDPDWRPNPLLPDTKGEIAVPINLQDEVLGVLDVQSDRAGGLSEDDRLLLEGICGQIASAFASTRLRQEAEERLVELDALYRATTREGWRTYLQADEKTNSYLVAEEEIKPAGDLWQKEMEPAIAQNKPVRIDENNLFVNPLSLRGEVIGALAIQDTPEQPLSQDDLALVAAISDQVALAMESARLFEQTQLALSETQALYSIIAEMNAAEDYHDILKALWQNTLLERADQLLLMAVFDRPADETSTPEWIYPVADRAGTKFEIAKRYPLNAFEADPGTLFTDKPVMLEDVSSDPRLDRVTRTLFQEVFQAKSSIVIPLNLADQMIGFVQGYFSRAIRFPETEVERLMAVAGQAAIAVQSRLLFEQAQSRARQEERIREVTAEVITASDVDSIMRRAVEQVGRVLGMPAFIYLGEGDKQTENE